MSIPVISPVELKLGGPRVRKLPAPDYEILALPAAVLPVPAEAPRDPAAVALDQIEAASQISEYHDFSWWDERIQLIRTQLEHYRTGAP